mgnify:CR=1 FL=1
MASTKEYRDFILEQLSEAPNITCRPMMGEFLLYSNLDCNNRFSCRYNNHDEQ